MIEKGQLDRLRKLAEEPERTAMARTEQFPTMAAGHIALVQELVTVRAGLAEAVALIEMLQRDAELNESIRKEELSHWQQT